MNTRLDPHHEQQQPSNLQNAHNRDHDLNVQDMRAWFVLSPEIRELKQQHLLDQMNMQQLRDDINHLQRTHAKAISVLTRNAKDALDIQSNLQSSLHSLHNRMDRLEQCLLRIDEVCSSESHT